MAAERIAAQTPRSNENARRGPEWNTEWAPVERDRREAELSDRGVKYHVRKIFRQYGVTSREALIAKFGRFEVAVKWVPNEKENRQ